MIPVLAHTLAGATHNADTLSSTFIVWVKLSEHPDVVALYFTTVAPEPVKHNPEAEVDNKVNFHIASNRTQTTKDRVFDKIFNNN